MSELPLRLFNCIYSRGGKLPKLNHENMTKSCGYDKAEIPRHPLLQLHFQAHGHIPTSLGRVSQTGKHLHKELLVSFCKILGNFNNSDSNLSLLSLVIWRCTFTIKDHTGEDLKKENECSVSGLGYGIMDSVFMGLCWFSVSFTF